MKKRWMAVLMAVGMLLPCGNVPQVTAESSVVYDRLKGLPFENGDPFKGVDVSSALALEESGVVFRDSNGNPTDLFTLLADHGVNTVRIRIWNDPYHLESRKTYGSGSCDADCAVKLAKRCADAGLHLLVDFYYSDFWANPAKQSAPKAWTNYSIDEKANAIAAYTTDTLTRIAATGAEITMVQIGNETTNGMCGVWLDDYDWSESGWQQLAKLWNAGAKAVRAFDPEILVALHFTNPEQDGKYAYIAQMLDQVQVDYDVFATSYYPYWHGTLDNLQSVLTSVAETYDKQVLVAETSWSYTLEDSDCFANTIGQSENLGDYVDYPVSPEGQTAFLTDLFEIIAAIPDSKGLGVCYWAPAWISVGTDYTQNLERWERTGSGWATKAAKEYDADGAYYGGSSVDNQALFDANGKPLSSLSVFANIVGDGQYQPVKDVAGNLLSNPHFEQDMGWTDAPSGWQLYNSGADHFDVRAEDPHSGSYALHWYSETAFSDSKLSTAVTVPEDGEYLVSFHMQGDTQSHYQANVTINGRETVSGSGTGQGWSDWQNPALTVTARAGDTIHLKVSVSSAAASYGSMDDFVIRKITDRPEMTTTTTNTETTTPPPQPIVGDIDEDGSFTVADLVLLNRYLSEDSRITISPNGLHTADYNRDGQLSSVDCLLLQHRLSYA